MLPHPFNTTDRAQRFNFTYGILRNVGAYGDKACGDTERTFQSRASRTIYYLKYIAPSL
jgi:hypothetical protein